MLGRILPGDHRGSYQEAGDLMKHYWATVFSMPLTTLRGEYIHKMDTTLFYIKGILKLSAAISLIIFICSAPIQKIITKCAGYQIIRTVVLVCFSLLCYIFIILGDFSSLSHPSLFVDKSEWVYGLSITFFHPLSICVAAIFARLLKRRIVLSINKKKKVRTVNYKNTTLFIAGLYAFGLVGFLVFSTLFDLLGLEPLPRAFSVCLSAWICWLMILFCRKIRILPLQIRTKTGAKKLAILTAFFFLQLLIIDQMAGPYRGSNVAAGMNPLHGRSIGLAIWYWTALILELYFGMQLICTAPIQHWIQKERVKNTSIVLICFSFMLYGMSILANSPVKFMHRADITGVLILLCVTLLQPLTIWLVVVIIRTVRALINRDNDCKLALCISRTVHSISMYSKDIDYKKTTIIIAGGYLLNCLFCENGMDGTGIEGTAVWIMWLVMLGCSQMKRSRIRLRTTYLIFVFLLCGFVCVHVSEICCELFGYDVTAIVPTTFNWRTAHNPTDIFPITSTMKEISGPIPSMTASLLAALKRLYILSWAMNIIVLYCFLKLMCCPLIQGILTKFDKLVRWADIPLVCLMAVGSIILLALDMPLIKALPSLHRCHYIVRCLVHPLTVYILIVILRSIGKLIYGNKTWKEVFLFKTK